MDNAGILWAENRVKDGDKTFVFSIPVFAAYTEPLGALSADKACHALWYYYLSARHVWETHIADPIVLEGDKDPEYNFKQMFTSIATWYGVTPETMKNFWDRIDKQCDRLGLPKLPDEDRYRFNLTPEIRTQ